MNDHFRHHSNWASRSRAFGAMAACLAAAAGLALAGGPGGSGGQGANGPHAPEYSGDSPYAHLPSTYRITGVLREFRAFNQPAGHPDFGRRPNVNFGLFIGNVAEELDEQNKPVFTGEGRRVVNYWRDSAGNNINPSFYDPARGDIAGEWGEYDTGGVTSAASFHQWYRDIPGMNMSGPFSITLVRQPDTDVYVFDDRLPTHFAQYESGGYDPNNDGDGQAQGGNRNFNYTYEVSAEFIYRQGEGQTFTFEGDDDVWVFIDGRLAADIGGIHSPVKQTVHLDRLDWLEDGAKHTLHFFYAQRYPVEAKFRLETSLALHPAALPPTMSMYD